MLILGGEVLLSFATESVLQPRFDALSPLGRWFCASGLLLLVFSIGLLMWPAAYHRIICRGEDQVRLLHFTSKVLSIGLIPLALAISSGLFVAGERISGSQAGLWISAAFLVSAGSAWYLYPACTVKKRDKPRRTIMSPNRRTSVEEKVDQVLTEARMVLPGAQALLGFGTIAVLTERFDELPVELKILHGVGLCFIALTTVLLMTPAAYHRIAEGGEDTERFHRVATRLVLAAMATLGPGMGASIWLTLERVSGSRAVGAFSGVSMVLLLYGMWFGWTTLRARSRRSATQGVINRTTNG